MNAGSRDTPPPTVSEKVLGEMREAYRLLAETQPIAAESSLAVASTEVAPGPTPTSLSNGEDHPLEDSQAIDLSNTLTLEQVRSALIRQVSRPCWTVQHRSERFLVVI